MGKVMPKYNSVAELHESFGKTKVMFVNSERSSWKVVKSTAKKLWTTLIRQLDRNRCLRNSEKIPLKSDQRNSSSNKHLFW